MSAAVRAVTVGDVAAVQAMAARFLSPDGPYGDRFQAAPDRIAILVQLMTAEGETAMGFIAEQAGVPVGMFGVFCLIHPITGAYMASELCWWMEPEARGSRVALRLLRAGEAWARARGAAYLEMIAPSERVASFYGRLGYTRTDVHYLKRL